MPNGCAATANASARAWSASPPVPVYENDIDALVAHDRLKPEDKADTGKVAEAVEYLVDAWVRGELAPKDDA